MDIVRAKMARTLSLIEMAFVLKDLQMQGRATVEANQMTGLFLRRAGCAQKEVLLQGRDIAGLIN